MEKIKFDNIIWDYNGTLLNDVDYALGLINKLLEQHSLSTISKEYYLDKCTFPVKNLYIEMGFDLKRTPFGILSREFIEPYHRGIHNCDLQTGAIDLLSNLKTLNVKQFICSAMEQNMLFKALDNHKLAPYFKDIFGVKDHLGAGKITEAKNLMKQHSLDPKRTLFVGDTAHDAEVADKIGCKCVLLAMGHQSHQVLSLTNKTIFTSFKQLSEFLIESDQE